MSGIGRSRYIRTVSFFPAAPAAASVTHSSSIGRNSDCCSAGGEEGGETEVQSSYKGPLENMDSLEESLPIRSGLSRYYCGKSRSFAVISDAITKLSSGKELGKPRNAAYSRKRKKLLGMVGWWENGGRWSGGGASKRHAIAETPFSASDEASISLPARSFSVMNLEGIEGLSSASSSFSSASSGGEGIYS